MRNQTCTLIKPIFDFPITQEAISIIISCTLFRLRITISSFLQTYMTDQGVTDIGILPHLYILGSARRGGFPDGLIEELFMSDFEHCSYAADL